MGVFLMKKIWGLLAVGIISFGLAGCGTNNSASSKSQNANSSSDTLELTKTELHSDYDDTAAAVISTLKKVSTDDVTSEARHQLTEVRQIRSELKKNNSHNNLTKDLIKYSKSAQDSIIALRDDTDTKSDGESFGEQTDKIAKKYFNDKLPSAYQNFLDSYSSDLSEADDSSESGASDSKVTNDSVVTPDYTIKITKTEMKSGFDSGTVFVVYYDFTNNSDKNIIPEDMFINGDLKQENDTSVVTLDTGVADDDYEAISALEDASQQEAKPGATIQCAETYELDNTDNSVDYVAKDDNLDEIGTITLPLN